MDACLQDGMVLFDSKLVDCGAEGRTSKEGDIVAKTNKLVRRCKKDVDFTSSRVGEKCDVHGDTAARQRGSEAISEARIGTGKKGLQREVDKVVSVQTRGPRVGRSLALLREGCEVGQGPS